MLPCQRNRLAIARGVALLATLGLGFVLGPAVCRADDTLTYHLKVKEFEIPYAVDANPNFKQVTMFASTDRKTYSQIGSAAKREGAFPYTATGDGEYFFVVQVEDINGVRTPPTPELVPPTVRIFVDTQKPQVTIRAVQPKANRAAVEWHIVDANIDLRTLRLETKGSGEMAWTQQIIKLLPEAQYDWNPQGGGPIDVRLSVKDLAGNEATATCQVSPTVGAAPVAGPGDDRQVIFVKHKRFHLTYKIAGTGPSKLKHVEVWVTRDRSQWQRFGKAAPEVGPHEVTVQTTGRYGFTLRPISGVGRGPVAPRGGDSPQIWVEVDETPPEVKINSVHVGEGSDSGKVVVNWSATDKFMKDQPIAIFYSESATGPWRMLQENLENTGSTTVTPPKEVYEFFVKVEAVDKAGNKGSAQMRESIKVDLSVPMPTDVGVQAIEVAPAAAQP